MSVTDTLGRELRFSTPPGRIVSLNVSEQIGDIPGAQAHALAITRPAGSLLPPPPPGDPVEPVVPVRFSLR